MSSDRKNFSSPPKKQDSSNLDSGTVIVQVKSGVNVGENHLNVEEMKIAERDVSPVKLSTTTLTLETTSTVDLQCNESKIPTKVQIEKCMLSKIENDCDLMSPKLDTLEMLASPSSKNEIPVTDTDADIDPESASLIKEWESYISCMYVVLFYFSLIFCIRSLHCFYFS